MGSHHLTTGIQYNIMGSNLKRAPVQEPEVEQTIKVEEPESKRFKKDDVMREKTRRENIERDDKIAREKVNLIREKQKNRISQEKNRISQEKNRISQEKNRISQEKNRISQEKKKLSQETRYPQGKIRPFRTSRQAQHPQG